MHEGRGDAAVAPTARGEPIAPPVAPGGRRPPRRRVILAFAAVYITWGSTYLGIAYAVHTIPVFLMGAMRFMIAGLALLAVALARGAPRPSPRELRGAAVAGVLLLTCGNTGVVWAETRIASGTTALLVTTPFWFVVFEWVRGRRPSPAVLAGLALGALGIVILVAPHHVGGASRVDPFTVAVLLVSSTFWAAGSLYTRYASLPRSPLLATGLEMVWGAVALFVVAGATGELVRFDPREVAVASWMGFAYLVIFGSWVGFTAYIWLMRNVPTAHAATYAFVNPVVAVVLGWAVAGEPLTGRT